MILTLTIIRKNAYNSQADFMVVAKGTKLIIVLLPLECDNITEWNVSIVYNTIKKMIRRD